jgi:hypothetical protein
MGRERLLIKRAQDQASPVTFPSPGPDRKERGGFEGQSSGKYGHQFHGLSILAPGAAGGQNQQPLFSLFAGAQIEGPLPEKTARESDGLIVTQHDALHAEIVYGDSRVKFNAEPGDTYAFAIGPPIRPPQPPQTSELVLSGPDPEAKPVLPQRLIRVTSTRPIVEEEVDREARVLPLVVQTRFVPREQIDEQGTGLMGPFEVIESEGEGYAQLQLEDSMIRIEVDPAAGAVAGDLKRRFAYWIDPEWTGPMGNEKRVVIVASPGVSVRKGSPAHAPVIQYGRRLVDEVIRVPHPKLVPEQGTPLSLEKFTSVEVVDPEAPKIPSLVGLSGLDGGEHRDAIQIATGRAGVSILHPWSGARLSLRPMNAAVGAAYAWQILPPLNGLPGEIRAVVGPGVDVELQEPVPLRLRDPYGGTPTPRHEEADTGEGLKEQTFELKLVEVADPSDVPVQGTPLNIAHLASRGRYREPDRHQWLGTNDLPFMIATTVVDIGISLIPIVGQLYAIGSFTYTMTTGRDVWGREVDEGGKVLMGVGAVLSVLPLVGGLRSVLRGSADAAAIARLASRWGVTVEELEAVLARVGANVDGADAALVQRAISAIQKGENFAEAEIPALQRVLAKVGAGDLGIEGIARSAGGRVELALAAAGEAQRSENYFANLMSAYRTTGDIPESLATPLARSGQFGTAEEAEMAIQQALRDLARAEGVAADEALIAATAKRSGQVMSDVQAAGIVELNAPTRVLSVSQPQLVAAYEEAVNKMLPQVMEDVLRAQRSTAVRRDLVRLRAQFDQLLAEAGGSERLTAAQRDLANQILREARVAAEKDFGNVRSAVWRRLRRNPELAQIEDQLRAAGDIPGGRSGALRVRMATAATGEDAGFQPLNLEHRVRRSDNPWLYNDPDNLVLTDAAQNQQYLEALRREGSIWPSGVVEDFVIRHGLNDEGVNFAPHSR